METCHTSTNPMRDASPNINLCFYRMPFSSPDLPVSRDPIAIYVTLPHQVMLVFFVARFLPSPPAHTLPESSATLCGSATGVGSIISASFTRLAGPGLSGSRTVIVFTKCAAELQVEHYSRLNNAFWARNVASLFFSEDNVRIHLWGAFVSLVAPHLLLLALPACTRSQPPPRNIVVLTNCNER